MGGREISYKWLSSLTRGRCQWGAGVILTWMLLDLVTGVPTPSFGLTLDPVSLEELTHRADAIVVGEVQAVSYQQKE